LTDAALAAAVIITCGAAVCQSLTGFGFALVMLPLLSLVWDVKSAVVVTSVLSTISLMPLSLQARHHVRLATALAMLAGSLVGTPAGLWILEWIDPQGLKICVGVVIVAAFVAYKVREVRAVRRRGNRRCAGVMSGAAAQHSGWAAGRFHVQGTEPSGGHVPQAHSSSLLLSGLYMVGVASRCRRPHHTEVVTTSAITLPRNGYRLVGGFWPGPASGRAVPPAGVGSWFTSVAVIISAARDMM
jgi:uncharacterized membrane protein YfcA